MSLYSFTVHVVHVLFLPMAPLYNQCFFLPVVLLALAQGTYLNTLHKKEYKS